MTETLLRSPPAAAAPADPTDLLADVLQRIHLASAILLRAEFSAPWAFTSVDEATVRSLLPPVAPHIVLFHVSLQGPFEIRLDSGEQVIGQAGDAVVMPYCNVHTMGHPAGTDPVSIAQLLPPFPWAAPPVLRHGGGGAPTQILCGYLQCNDLLFNPVLRVLPRLLHVRPGSPQAAQWREASLRYALEEGQRPGPQAAVLAKLPQMVLVDCLRQYAASLPPGQKGWLGALADPVLSRALMLLHARPAEPWTVDALARKCAASRSVLAERFAGTLGVSPMRYLAQWRMQLASDLLRDEPRLGLAAVADRVGYESEAAFSRAYKRHVGVAPGSAR
jgi:AraC-like DNA-binding protein